ncbi:hypothetical protein S40285_06586 [Stachybotrys chlorohalonatus IBT 40285]|uniref:Peroxin 26 n=1 Tax=Stachybotrys chlorohalonatus (strain IBT 40285) TaxID=1283841 RepID=A0A084QHH6_STAC4|nr:hypothetical protein S40285_06586 [Stachybotrys chlorohalonata IBT 40285]
MAANGYSVTLNPASSMAASEPFTNNALRSSLSSLRSSNSPRQASPVSKTYRQASTLFLTRRLPEALTTLLPLITAPASSDDGEPAPVAKASRTTRVKVWSLYLTILNAVLELELDEGKQAFGNQEWRTLCSKVRDGEVWEEVIRNGYHGVEGDVDLEVVINLATLLLAHAPDQSRNQKRLEGYLATSSAPSLDLSGRLDEIASPGSHTSHRYRSPAKGTSGANTPRDLNSRVKLLELYTLHVLTRNDEWEHAHEFISASPMLDEERREAFLQALQSLQDERNEQERLEREEQQRQEDQLKRDVEEARKLQAETEEKERKQLEERRLKREGSEVDYGIEGTPNPASPNKDRQTRAIPHAKQNPRSSASRSGGKAAGPVTLAARANLVMSRMRVLLYQISASLNSNPALLMRLLAFVLGLILMFAQRGIRERVQRILGVSWNKVKATAGMGTKVSYI